METVEQKKIKAKVAEHPVADMASRVMPPTLTRISASERTADGPV